MVHSLVLTEFLLVGSRSFSVEIYHDLEEESRCGIIAWTDGSNTVLAAGYLSIGVERYIIIGLS